LVEHFCSLEDFTAISAVCAPKSSALGVSALAGSEGISGVAGAALAEVAGLALGAAAVSGRSALADATGLADGDALDWATGLVEASGAGAGASPPQAARMVKVDRARACNRMPARLREVVAPVHTTCTIGRVLLRTVDKATSYAAHPRRAIASKAATIGATW